MENRRNIAGFLNEGKEGRIPYEEYHNKFVVVTKTSGGNFAGRYVGISKEGNMVFNPHDANEYVGSRLRKKVQESDKQVHPSLIGEIEETSRESLEGFCRYVNLYEFAKEQKRVKDSLTNSLELLKQFRFLHNIKS
jgi:hypothetical protein